MAYSPLPSKVAGNTINLVNWDNLRDNFAAGVPDLFTSRGDLAAATGADVATRLGVGDDDSTLVADSVAGSGLAWQIQPACRVYNDEDLNLAPLDWRIVTFNSERYDLGDCHSLIANTGRITIPAGGGGIYHVGACIEFGSTGGAGTADMGVRIRENGSQCVVKSQGDRPRTGFNVVIVVSCDIPLAAGEYVETETYTEADIDIMYFPNYTPAFWAHWIRRA